jgi:ATP-dependent Lhr-like helicase
LLRLWRRGYVEPVVPPPHPRHIEAQQLLALALQEGRIGLNTWRQWWPGLAMMADGQQILDHLLAAGFLATDEGFAFIGDSAERHFGRRNFMDLTAVFTVAPELAVVQGRKPIGTISPLALGPRDQPGPRLLSLAGRTWRVTHIDWRSRQVAVVADSGHGKSRWATGAIGPGLSFELAQSIRQVLLGHDPDVELSRRAVGQLRLTREERADLVDPSATVIAGTPESTLWWTFAGDNANRSLAAALTACGVAATSDTFAVRSPRALTATHLRAAADLLAADPPPAASLRPDVVDGLKFSAALPPDVAVRTLTERITDPVTALRVARG